MKKISRTIRFGAALSFVPLAAVGCSGGSSSNGLSSNVGAPQIQIGTATTTLQPDGATVQVPNGEILVNPTPGFSPLGSDEQLVAYLVFRGTTPNFIPSANTLQQVIDARSLAPDKGVNYTQNVDDVDTDPSVKIAFEREETPTAPGEYRIIMTREVVATPAAPSLDIKLGEFEYDESGLPRDVNCYYKVGRLTADKTPSTVTDPFKVTYSGSRGPVRVYGVVTQKQP